LKENFEVKISGVKGAIKINPSFQVTYIQTNGGHTVPPQNGGCNRVRQSYKNISMLFLFPVKDGKLSTGINATFDASCYG